MLFSNYVLDYKQVERQSESGVEYTAHITVEQVRQEMLAAQSELYLGASRQYIIEPEFRSIILQKDFYAARKSFFESNTFVESNL